MNPGRSASLGGAAGVVLVAAWLALVEVFWLPLRIAGVLVPLSTAAAVAGNLLLPAAAHRLSGSRVVGLLPVLVWGVVAAAATIRRPEGDLVLTGGGGLGTTNLLFLLLGGSAAAVAVARLLAAPRRAPLSRAPRDPDPDGAAPAAPAGSGTGGAR
jgi:hypothetical protein